MSKAGAELEDGARETVVSADTGDCGLVAGKSVIR